uniref:Reverse transcriptase zinc-binding domain-containing protein n=1 Tax=Manihot esculenta TaxID=3983 RepID=A0A2C9VWC6_MANES
MTSGPVWDGQRRKSVLLKGIFCRTYEAQELLQLGVRWQVGDGVDIKVWGDSWLGRNDNFFVQTSNIDGLKDLSISGSLSYNGTWNVSLINELLSSNNAKVVVRTPLSQRNMTQEVNSEKN